MERKDLFGIHRNNGQALTPPLLGPPSVRSRSAGHAEEKPFCEDGWNYLDYISPGPTAKVIKKACSL